MARAETGLMRFGDDWTGVFIRGDDAFHYKLALQTLIEEDDTTTVNSIILGGLLGLLESSDQRSKTQEHLELQVMIPFENAVQGADHE